MTEQDQLRAKLEKLDQAIANLEGLRGVLADDEIEAALSDLRKTRTSVVAALTGSGAVAVGDGTTAAGKRGVAVDGDVAGNIVTGDHVVINELPPPVLEMFARRFGFDPGASDADALKTYFDNVVFERHSRLSFLFIRPDTGKVYTEADVETVFVPLRITDPEAAKPKGRSNRHLERFSGAPGEEMAEAMQPVTLPEILGKYDCFLLRGKPGCGKTTLLRHVALAFARGEHGDKLGWEGPAPLPLLIPLRNFGAFLRSKGREGRYVDPQPRALLEYLEEHLRGANVVFSADFLRRRLDDGDCLLLLDALDEASGTLDDGGDLRAAVARQVSAFIRHYLPRGNRFALTSRPRAFEEGGGIRRALPQPKVCDVLDLDQARYHELIVNLLVVLTGSEAAGRAEAQDLIERISVNRQLADLASNPLLCTTLVLVYKYRGRKLPERRVDVLHEIVTLLLGRWEEERRDVTSPGELARLGTKARTTDQAIQFRRRALVALAWQMQQEAAPEVAVGDAVRVLAEFYCAEERTDEVEARKWAGEFLEVAHERSGLFIAADEGMHTFAHQAFREYLAATHLVNAGEPRLLAEVRQRAPAPDEWWEQVILLAGAHPELGTGAAGRLVEMLLEPGDVAHAYLAARCARDMTDKLPGPQRKRLQDGLLGVMRDQEQPAQNRARAGQALALAGDPRFEVETWYLPNEPLLGFVEIPAGPFEMGTEEGEIPGLVKKYGGERDWYEDETPQRHVDLSQYYIARYPVTVAQFGAFVADGGYGAGGYWPEAQAAGYWADGMFQGERDDEPRNRPEDYGEPFNLPNHPIVGVTWYEALAYCHWLTGKLREWQETPEPLGRLLRGEGWVITLPSEAEWEKAARGTDGRVFPWGDEHSPNLVNHYETGIGTTSAVGCFPGGAGPYGLEDQSGNVDEWTRSLFRRYPYDPEDDRENLQAEGSRVLRGGAFVSGSWVVRAAGRDLDGPDFRYGDLGFRVVAAPR